MQLFHHIVNYTLTRPYDKGCIGTVLQVSSEHSDCPCVFIEQ